MCSAWQSWGVGKLLERVEHLVVEDGEVERESESDGVGRLYLALGREDDDDDGAAVDDGRGEARRT